MRGIEVYHVKGNGWNDIGYNFLVDKYGQVFEGRYGGIDKNVIGAHAEGFNTGSIGVALLGTYGTAAPTAAAQTALANLLAWRLDLAHVDPLSTLTWISGGNARFPAGVARLPARGLGPPGHGLHDVPGRCALRAARRASRAKRASVGLPKLFAPTVRGGLGGQVRFQARLSESLPWTVTVTDATRQRRRERQRREPDDRLDLGCVDSRAGAATVDDRCRGRACVPRPGRSVRSRSRWRSRRRRRLPRTITPNGDGQTDSTQIAYTLTAPATVTATLRASRRERRSAVALLASQGPGKQSFRFTAAGIADGRYEIVLSAVERAHDGDCVRVRFSSTGPFAALPLHAGGLAERRRQWRRAHVRFRAHATRSRAARDRAGGKDTSTSVYAADFCQDRSP